MSWDFFFASETISLDEFKARFPPSEAEVSDAEYVCDLPPPRPARSAFAAGYLKCYDLAIPLIRKRDEEIKELRAALAMFAEVGK